MLLRIAGGVWLLWIWGKRAAHSSQDVDCDATTVQETCPFERQAYRGNDWLVS